MTKRFDIKIEDDRLIVYNLHTEPLYIKEITISYEVEVITPTGEKGIKKVKQTIPIEKKVVKVLDIPVVSREISEVRVSYVFNNEKAEEIHHL
ncbi:hypothetical protein D1867_07065 [Acidianus infernus]|uniref:Uncharacterized protein n=1 Tax=Acidianus infernus TaxID=12915 RepID=A0A6A9QFQ0_ACIIN|nr:hypothetical protein [Acidianus infernus]MCY0874345.1 hypothetical protein [Acidianus infernus]MCY0883768.1 hypothetical protein [Acidianus infernus]MUM65004.1 hypothetical protein [Acidianus infernus]